MKNILEARKTLGLGERATLKEIKNKYRDLAKKYHPDRCSKKRNLECQKRMVEVINSYKLILSYTKDYRFSFEEAEIRKQSPEETLWENYSEDWFWGRGEQKK
ncbi:MAG: J domain-containing protein [Candidatus Altiarchaeota archaeon]